MANDLSVGDELPPDCELIEVHVTDLRMFFNPIDPSPPTERDLESKAEEFIVDWARSARRDARLALRIEVDTPTSPEEAETVGPEMFLYDWWPIRAERQLYDRLSVMPVRVTLNAGSDRGGL